MDLKNLIEKDGERAVSPVIGVILMVAITVILAAVIGAFVIGIGEDQEVQPTASFNFDFSSADPTNDVEAELVVAHSTGDTISEPDSLFVSIEGDRLEWDTAEDTLFDDDIVGDTYRIATDGSGSYAVSSGSQVTIEKVEADSGTVQNTQPDWDDESVSVVWESETGDSSATLSSTTAPS